MNRKTYMALWPDGTVSIVKAATPLDLFDALDEESNPHDITALVDVSASDSVTTTLRKRQNQD